MLFVPKVIVTGSKRGVFNLLSPPDLFTRTTPMIIFPNNIRIEPRGLFSQLCNSLPEHEELVVRSMGLLLMKLQISYDVHASRGNTHIATFLLVVIWFLLRPFYIVVMRNRVSPDSTKWLHITIGEFSLRIYFCWVTGAIILGVVNIEQFYYGAYFSFGTYAGIVGAMLAVAIEAYVYNRDAAVALVMTWFIMSMVRRKMMFQDDSDIQDIFDKLQLIANAIVPVFLILLLIDAIRSKL